MFYFERESVYFFVFFVHLMLSTEKDVVRAFSKIIILLCDPNDDGLILLDSISQFGFHPFKLEKTICYQGKFPGRILN